MLTRLRRASPYPTHLPRTPKTTDSENPYLCSRHSSSASSSSSSPSSHTCAHLASQTPTLLYTRMNAPPPSLVVRVYYAIPHEYTHILYSVRNVLYERKHIAQKRRLTNEKRSRVELYALQRNWFSRYLSILFSSFLCFILPINGPPVSAKPFDTMPSRSFAYFFLFLFFL